MFNNIIFTLEFSFLKQFPYKYKNYLLVDSENFFDSYRSVYSIRMGTCLLIRQGGNIETNPVPKPNPHDKS